MRKLKWYQTVENDRVSDSPTRIISVVFAFLISLPCTLYIVYYTMQDWTHNNFSMENVWMSAALIVIVNLIWIMPKSLGKLLEIKQLKTNNTQSNGENK